MRQFEIVVLEGDGIGPEVIAQATRLVRQCESRLQNVSFRWEHHEVGAAHYLKAGEALPEATLAACRRCDAILLGAMGLPDVRYADGKEIAPQLDLREQLGLYGGVRPIRLFHADDTPLKGYRAGEIDFVLVRESTEGLFAGRGETYQAGASEAVNTLRITRTGARRVCRLAFDIARRRGGRKRVALIDKANVLSSMVFFREVFDEVAAEYPDCAPEHVYVDAAALFLVRDPARFDVMVTENMFGDILSDLAAGLVGGMGMAPSGDIGDSAAVFQPAHGSAPDIAGRGIANPIATILSAAMMLDWLAHPETIRAGKAIETAVAKVLSNPAYRTPDMGGKLTTQQLGDSISAELDAVLSQTPPLNCIAS